MNSSRWKVADESDRPCSSGRRKEMVGGPTGSGREIGGFEAERRREGRAIGKVCEILPTVLLRFPAILR